MNEFEMVQAVCSYCHASTSFIPIFSKVIYGFDPGEEEEFTLARCKSCDEVALFWREEMSFQRDLYGEGFEIPFHRLWPTEPRELNFEVPKEIATAYNEAVNAEKHQLWMAASVMTGRVLEAVCKYYAPDTKSIFTGIAKMKGDGALSDEMYRWSNEIRILRNTGAHSSDQKITGSDVGYALDFLKAILEVIFEIRPKFEQFQRSKSEN